MKTGVVLTAVGSIAIVALIVFLAMNLIMGDYVSAIWMTIYTGILGGLFLYNGIKRINKVKGGNYEQNIKGKG